MLPLPRIAQSGRPDLHQPRSPADSCAYAAETRCHRQLAILGAVIAAMIVKCIQTDSRPSACSSVDRNASTALADLANRTDSQLLLRQNPKPPPDARPAAAASALGAARRSLTTVV